MHILGFQCGLAYGFIFRHLTISGVEFLLHVLIEASGLGMRKRLLGERLRSDAFSSR